MKDLLKNGYGAYIVETDSELEGKSVSVAGRLMSKRGMGKVGFCHMADISVPMAMRFQVSM